MNRINKNKGIFMKRILQSAFFLLFLVSPVVVFSQSASKQEKKIERMKEKRMEEDLKLYQKAIKRHQKIQSKDTRKRMKKDRKQAFRHNDNKREFFLKRWFTPKQKKKPAGNG